MSARDDRTRRDPAPGRDAPAAPSAPPAYEPPAVSWEEPFEAMVAGSCALFDFDMNCQGRGMA